MTFPKFLKIAVVAKENILLVNKTADGEYKVVGGPEGKVVEILARAFKLSYKLIPTPDGTWGSLIDGSWTGAIGMVCRNEADIAISKLGISPLRSQYVDFSYPYILEDLTFTVQKPGLRSTVNAFAHPFAFNLWLSLAVAIILMAIVFSLFHNMSFLRSTMQVFGILTRQSANTLNKNVKEMFIMAAWLLAALFLTYSYVAVLLSFLTVPRMRKGIENVEELSEAIADGTYQARVYKGSLILRDLLNSQRDVVKLIGKHIEKYHNVIEPDCKVILEALRKEKVAIITLRSLLNYCVQDEFRISKDLFNSQPIAIVTSKHFCCINDIDNFIHTFSASGLYQKYMEDEMFITGLKSKPLENTLRKKSRPLSVNDLLGSFVLIVVGNALATVIAFCEIFYFKQCANRKRIKSADLYIRRHSQANTTLPYRIFH